MLRLQLPKHTGGVGQAEFLKRTVSQHPTPTVKNHHRLGTGLDLRIEVQGYRVGVDLKNLVHQVRTAVKHGLDQAIVV